MTEQTPLPTSNQMSPDLRATHVRWLSIMLEYYSGEETALRARLDKREVWGDGHENEWRRYQAEAAALRAAIEALSGNSSAPTSIPSNLRTFLGKVADLGCSTVDSSGKCIACEAADFLRGPLPDETSGLTAVSHGSYQKQDETKFAGYGQRLPPESSGAPKVSGPSSHHEVDGDSTIRGADWYARIGKALMTKLLREHPEVEWEKVGCDDIAGFISESPRSPVETSPRPRVFTHGLAPLSAAEIDDIAGTAPNASALAPAKCACTWYNTHGVHSADCTAKASTCPKCEAVRKLGLTSCFEHKQSENGKAE